MSDPTSIQQLQALDAEATYSVLEDGNVQVTLRSGARPTVTAVDVDAEAAAAAALATAQAVYPVAPPEPVAPPAPDPVPEGDVAPVE